MNIEQFYPTPQELLEKVFKDTDWRTVATILEPSAGNGDICDYIMDAAEKYPYYNKSFDIFKAALLSNTVNIFLFHNHLSGDVRPSRDDLLITERVKKSGELLGVRLLDHIILGDNGAFYSLREDEGIL